MNSRHRSPTLPALLKIMLLVAVVVAVAAIALARRSIFPSTVVSNAPVSAVKNEVASPATAQRQRPIANIEAELVTVTPHGFEPREITRLKGRFLLMIDDRSGLSATSLQLAREAGPRTHEMRVPREEPNWSDVVDLQPGRYVLTEADHPGWACRITITAQ